MRLLIAPDKFKGSLDAVDVAAALAAGWRAGWSDVLEVRTLAVADGGEGTAAAIADAVGALWVSCAGHDALGRPITARYALLPQGSSPRSAIIDASDSCGLMRIEPALRDPLRASTFGTGEVLRHALVDSGADRIVLGIGGSATNDGGSGLARALGYAFVDANGAEVPPGPAGLRSLARIEEPEPPCWPESCRVVVACDVRIPLLGSRGATVLFGPQKGLTQAADRSEAEAGLQRFADVVAATFGIDVRAVPGAGAGGGLAFGLLSLLGARAEIRSGFDVVAEALDLEAAVAWSDLVLTGEGRLDAQSLEGKAPCSVAALARRRGKRVVAFAGSIDVDAAPALAAVFDELNELRAVDPTLSQTECMARAAELLCLCATQAAQRWSARC